MNENQEFEFLKEKIKEKPINKKKLLRRTVITASMAAIFGLVACLTFLVLEPVFSNWLYPEEEPKIIMLPKEEKEIMPEDMLLEDPVASQTTTEVTSEEPEIVEKVDLEIEDYQNLYLKLSEVAKEASKSIVTVTGVTSDVDWFDNTYESKGQTAGVIVADNGKEIIILVKKKELEKAETIRVTFSDGKQATAVLKKENANTGLAALAIDKEALGETTKETIKLVEWGSSNGTSLLGSPVIAIGNPLGYNNSVAHGMITSIANPIEMVDCNYNLITTDIVGSQNASGILINLRGQLIGIIHQENNAKEMSNIVSVFGISELKNMIQKMSNGEDAAYLGIYAMNVTKEANEEFGVPIGVYVSEVEMSSPAMKAGIQSGDIIMKINDTYTDNTNDYAEVLNGLKPEDNAMLTIMRSSKNGYQQMGFSMKSGTMP